MPRSTDPRIEEQRELARKILAWFESDPESERVPQADVFHIDIARLAELIIALDATGVTRYARITARVYMDPDVIARYLPANYEVIGKDTEGAIYIAGVDNAGWTLDEYVLPRLESGLYFGGEIKL